MSRYKRYEKYKDSGVEWIGEIPEHWIHCKLGYLLVKNDSGTWGDDYDDDGVVVLRSTEITLNGTWSIVDPARRMIPVKEYERCLLREGDLILTKSSGSEQHIGKTVIVDEDIAKMKCVFSNFMQRLRPENGKLLPKYLYYFLNVNGREQLFYLSTTTTGLKNISGSTINALKIQLPTMYEQVIIANFLDQKTAVIDDLIADKEKLIELLQEKRQAIITEAVTKGLNPNVKMKDSGVEWIGEIPEEWELIKIKFVGTIYSGNGFKEELQGKTEGDYPFFKVSDINGNGKLAISSNNYVDEDDVVNNGWNIIPKNSILFPKIGEALKKNHRKINACSCLIDNNIAAIKTNERIIDFNYFYYYFCCVNAEWFVNPGAVPSINNAYLKNFMVLLPSKNEQTAIANFLDQKTAEIDDLITEIKLQIRKLKEYRQSLIFEAVTGKIDVRDYVVD